MTPALLAAKLALGPILLPQGLWVRRTALRLPEAAGERAGTVGVGATTLRVLVVGDSSAAGVGVADQAQALALPLAHRLQDKLGGAVQWQLVARTGIATADALAMVQSAHLAPADVVVTALGVNDVSGQTPPARYVAQLEQVWRDVQSRTGARWALCCGLPPMNQLTALPHPLRWYLGRCSDLLDGALQRWTRQQGLGYLSLRWSTDRSTLAEDGFHPGPALYPQWAARLADAVVAGRAQWERG
jgi:lysophospholipase L1-like esterase